MRTIIVMLFSVILLLVLKGHTAERRIRYIATERPHVEYNRKYMSYLNMTSRRFGRQDRLYYVDMHFSMLLPLGNNLMFHIAFYKDLPNRYQRLILEIRTGGCDLLENRFFGKAMRQGRLLGKCPFKPGDFNLYNMSIPFDAIPMNFPNFSGRIVANTTLATTKEFVAGGWIEMEVKTMKMKLDD